MLNTQDTIADIIPTATEFLKQPVYYPGELYYY